MSLQDERCKFSLDHAKLVMFINMADGCKYSCATNEVKREQAEADANAQKGIGTKSSLHLLGLAVDMLIYRMGVYLTDSDKYRFAGDYWKTLDSKYCWGGDFRDAAGNPKPDGGHFSRTYQGRK
jgi:hypothetical protein